MAVPLPVAHLNGRFLPLAEAHLSPLDRGFLFGDGVYEVIPAYGGRLFHLPGHLKRLQHSLDGIRLKNCLLYTSPSPRDPKTSRMPSSA